MGGKGNTDTPCAHTVCSVIKKSPELVQLLFFRAEPHISVSWCMRHIWTKMLDPNKVNHNHRPLTTDQTSLLPVGAISLIHFEHSSGN